MTRKITLITAIAGAALVFSVPAAWGDAWYVDRQEQTSVAVSPDVVERAVLARELSSGLDASVSPDAFERAVAAELRSSTAVGTYRDAFERAVGQRTATGLGGYRDAFERAVPQGKTSGPGGHVDRYELDLPSGPAASPVSGSGREIEWPQLGIGFGIGALLALGLFLAMRLTRIRPLAH